MLKYQRKLIHYENLFENETPIIVGSGPTDFDYKDLDKLKNPILFINDSVFLGDKKGRYFFTHHPDIERWLSLKSTYIFAETRNKKPYTEKRPEGPYVPIHLKSNQIRGHAGKFLAHERIPSWTLDKKYMIEHNILFSHWGSITSLIHFIWFCGAKKAIGIGISKDYENSNHDSRIPLNYEIKEPEYIGKCKGLKQIIHNQEVCLDFFKINMEYYK